MARSPDLPIGGGGTFNITLTFHDDLVLFLNRTERSRPVRRALNHKTSVKDVIEACGVPHPEVDLIIVNGKPVDFSFQLNTNAALQIFPVSAPSLPFPDFRLQARNILGNSGNHDNKAESKAPIFRGSPPLEPGSAAHYSEGNGEKARVFWPNRIV